MAKGTFHVESELAVSIRKTLDNAEERMDSMFDDDALCELSDSVADTIEAEVFAGG